VLCVGGENPRKNFAALAEVARALGGRVEVVTAGSRRAHHGRLEATGGVRALGYVDDALLPGLYAGAEVFVLPSLHEGFGLPCLEAMACGTPVVAAAAAALPETCGDAALLVEPRDAPGFADALMAAACEEQVRARLIEAGRRRAAEFSWTTTAKLTDALIEEVIGSG